MANILRRLSRLGGWVRHMQRDGDVPYLDRYSLREQRESGQNPWRMYLHKFLAADAVDHHHNHPSRWSFSIVLWGSYTEEVLEPAPQQIGATWPAGVRTRRVRWFNFISAQKYHRITELHPRRPGGAVWTLFFCGPLTGRGWGFWVPGRGHVPWKEHLGPQPLAVRSKLTA